MGVSIETALFSSPTSTTPPGKQGYPHRNPRGVALAAAAHHDDRAGCLPGLLPAALSTSIGSDSQKPFAIVIVAGLVRALPRFFVNPVLYEMVARDGDVLQV